MTLNVQLAINDYSQITITVPSLPEKDNVIFIPGPELHHLDIATVEYSDKDKNLPLDRDVVDTIFYSCYLVLERALSDAFSPPDHITTGNVGYYMNMFNEHRQSHLKVLKKFRAWWSRQDVQTIIYSRDNTIYLEIVPIYPWHLDVPSAEEEYESFNEFMQRYKPYVVKEIPRETIITWRNKCYKLLYSLIGKERMPSHATICKES